MGCNTQSVQNPRQKIRSCFLLTGLQECLCAWQDLSPRVLQLNKVYVWLSVKPGGIQWPDSCWLSEMLSSRPSEDSQDTLWMIVYITFLFFPLIWVWIHLLVMFLQMWTELSIIWFGIRLRCRFLWQTAELFLPFPLSGSCPLMGHWDTA